MVSCKSLLKISKNLFFVSDKKLFLTVNGFFKNCVLYNIDQTIMIPTDPLEEARLGLDCDPTNSDDFALFWIHKISKSTIKLSWFVCQSKI